MLEFSSSSSGFHQRKFKYGIFLSFCGKDTRKSFTDHLYSALRRKGIETFRDDRSLERGEDFAPELLRAIGESWGSIIVFSKEYAFSSWCLDELVEIMKQREERGHRVYPIFYHVEPCDFRHQRNTVEEAFKKHQGRYNNDKTQRWRLALKQVTGINGWPLTHQHESEFVEGIVKQISEKSDAEILDEQEVIKMKRNYQKIQAVLEIAEDKLYRKDGKAVKVWFDELKDMAYDIEDVLDEWNTAVLKSKIESNIQAQIPSTSLSLSIKVHNIPSTISLFGGIAIRIKELNKKLEATRLTNYLPLAGDPNSCIDHQRLEPSEKRLRLIPPKTTSLIDESDVCGRDHDKNALIRLLLKDKNGEGGSKGNGIGIPVIAIVGMGGLGKTTLAQLAYNNGEVKKHFHKRIWVCVSDPFDEVMIAKAILESLKGEPSKFNELQSLLEEIEEIIEGKKFFLVLDDVWTEDERKWEPLKLSLNFGSKESRIIVTTRKERVATMMHCSKPLIKPSVLSDEDSWSLFGKIAFFERSKEDCENLESIGRQFVKKCGGLPLAIKTLASLLRFKRTKEQWQRILDSEMWKLEDQIFEKLYAPLLLNYYDLPMSDKQCFRYCAIFPKDHRIERDELIMFWMAQGFLGEGDDMEIRGEECFDNLAIRGFFQDFENDEIDGSIIGCKMHDIVHDFAQFLTKPECLDLIVASCDGIEWWRQRQVESCHEKVRHLTLLSLGDPDSVIDGISGIDINKLRSFFFDFRSHSREDDSPKLIASLSILFHQLGSLRMLRFHCSNNFHITKSKIPKEIGKWMHVISLLSNNFLINKSKIPKEIGKLIHLRCLSFEGTNSLFELPETICDLCNLQTLNIRKCNCLAYLPDGMEKLINLRHLQNRDTNVIMPKGMSRLTSLQTLEVFTVSSSSDSFSLADLGKLIHLRGHLRIRHLGKVAEVSEAREARLSTMAGLHSLTLDFCEGDFDKEPQKRIEDDALILQALHPPSHFKILQIFHCQSPASPNWMTSLTWFKSVHLNNCSNWKSLPPFGKLPLLESLRIGFLDEVKKVGEEFLGIETTSSCPVNHIDFAFFPSLKVLDFYYMAGWEEWEYECEEQLVLRSRGGDSSSSSPSNTIPIIMPKLQRLSICYCEELKTLPDHLLQSRALQELRITGNTILYERYNKETGHDWPSISHIPQVDIKM